MHTNKRWIVRRVILNEVSDGYWDLETVERRVFSVMRSGGFDPNDSEVRTELLNLIKDGSLKAIRLSPVESGLAIVGVPRQEEMSTLHYFQTDQGRRENATELWPFEDNLKLLPELIVTED